MEKLAYGEVIKFISDFDKKYRALHERMDTSFDLWRLKGFELDNYSDNVTSSYPRFYAQAILGQMSGAKLIISVHRMDGKGESESLMEKAFYGWLRVIDENLVARLLPPLQSTASFMAAIRGFIAGRSIFKDIPEIFPYDPRYLKWGIDSKGIIWSGYVTYREPYSIEFEYDKKIKKTKTKEAKDISEALEIIEWITEKHYQIFADVEEVNSSDHSWKRPPTILVPVGTTPMIASANDKYDYVDTWGSDIYSSSGKLYEVQSKVLSIWLSLLGKSHNPSYFVFTPDGQMKIMGTPWGKGEMMPLPLDAKVQLVEPPDIANSAPQFFNIISALIGQGDYTPLFYGQLWKGQELSGKFMQSITENVQQVKGVLLQALSTFYKTGLRNLGEQFKNSSQNMKVSGYDSKENRFTTDISSDLFDGDYEIEVEFKSITPEQEAANYGKAQVAKQSQLASDSFIREKIIQFQDPDKVSREVWIEAAEKMFPKLGIKKMIEAYQTEGRGEEANILINEFAQATMQQLQQGTPQSPPQGGKQ